MHNKPNIIISTVLNKLFYEANELQTIVRLVDYAKNRNIT
jgi:hypothetical protein